MIVGFEGDEESVTRRRALTVRALRAGGAVYLGRAAGRSWEHGRYSGPYLRDTLMEMGAMVETLETSHTWTRLGELHRAVGAAIRGVARRPGHAGPRLLPPLARLRRRRLALLHLHLPRPPRRRARAVGGGQDGRQRGDRRQRRHDHPPPRGRPRPRPLHGGRGGGDGPRGAARGQGAPRPGRDHEPRQAPARAERYSPLFALLASSSRSARPTIGPVIVPAQDFVRRCRSGVVLLSSPLFSAASSVCVVGPGDRRSGRRFRSPGRRGLRPGLRTGRRSRRALPLAFTAVEASGSIFCGDWASQTV